MIRFIKRSFAALALTFLVGVSALAIITRIQGGHLLSVQSGSMVPALNKGDLVSVTRVPADKLQPGDIVTFINPRDKNSTVTHRIVQVLGSGNEVKKFVTKGDANQSNDTALDATQIIGKVRYSVPYVGYGADFIRKPLGLLLIIYIPSLMIIISEVRRLLAHYRSQQIYQANKRMALIGKRPREEHTNKLALSAKVLVLIMISGLIISPLVHAQLSSTATLTNNSISSVAVPISFTVCKFPGNESLLSYALMDALYPEQPDPPIQLNESIPAGTYKITAVSNDPHTANPSSPTQPNERWFAQLYTAESNEPDYVTGVTDDIPDNVDQVSTVVNDSITFTETVTGIRYAHNALNTGLEIDQFGGRDFDDLSVAEKRQVIWNSVHPGCITFERIQLPPVLEELRWGDKNYYSELFNNGSTLKVH